MEGQALAHSRSRSAVGNARSGPGQTAGFRATPAVAVCVCIRMYMASRVGTYYAQRADLRATGRARQRAAARWMRVTRPHEVLLLCTGPFDGSWNVELDMEHGT